MWLGRAMLMFSVLSMQVAFAASPEGLWATVDEHTHKKQAVVRIDKVNDALSVTIVEVYAEKDAKKVCTSCPGKWHGQPFLGMQFAWGFESLGQNTWGKGHILDPKTGKIYHANMTLAGDRLLVRGYIGVPVFGRTQTWERVTKS